MDDATDDLATAIAATLAKLRAQNEVSDSLAQVREAVRRLYHEHGMSAPGIARQLHDGLVAHGISEAQIERAGISHDRIRQMVGGRHRPDPPSA